MSLDNININDLPPNYMPSWYKKPSFQMRWDNIKKVYYYYKDGFPSIQNQTEWEGIYDAETFAYDNTVSWGKNLFNNSNCVAYAISCCMQIFNYLKTGDNDVFDVVWLHGNQSGGGTGFKKDGGKGAYVEEVLNKMITDGAVRNSVVHPYMCPYNQLQYDTVGANAPQGTGTAKDFVATHYSELLPKAQNYRLSSWQQIDNNSIKIKELVYSTGCALINMRMTSDLEEANIQADGVIHDLYTDYGDLTHLMTIIGWKEIEGITYWACVNHWGNWGYTAGDSNNKSGLCFIPVYYSKTLEIWKLTPSINPNFTWDYEKIKGNDFVFTHKEWNRLATRIKYKMQGGANIEKRYPNDQFRAYDYNYAVGDLKILNPSLVLGKIKKGDLITAKCLNDLVDAVNTI